ncbi:MAG: hypothetical protein H6891_07800 [Brucellaceae bacterium]|nr:hypothetical protein [Brucellaceae bacterium]
MSFTDYERPVLRQTLAETGFAWFLRVIAIFCLLFGVFYWIRLIGVYDGFNWRFDLMPVHWKIAAASLAVLFPFAALGLWLMASWGPILWFACAAIETVMYVWQYDLFSYRPVIAVTHAAIAVLYIAFRLVIQLQRRQIGYP